MHYMVGLFGVHYMVGLFGELHGRVVWCAVGLLGALSPYAGGFRWVHLNPPLTVSTPTF